MRCFCCARICFLADEIDFADGGASGGIGVERPLLHISTDTSYQFKSRGYLEILEDIASIPWLGFKAASSDCVRETKGLPCLIGRGRMRLSIILVVFGEMVKDMIAEIIWLLAELPERKAQSGRRN